MKEEDFKISLNLKKIASRRNTNNYYECAQLSDEIIKTYDDSLKKLSHSK